MLKFAVNLVLIVAIVSVVHSIPMATQSPETGPPPPPGLSSSSSCILVLQELLKQTLVSLQVRQSLVPTWIMLRAACILVAHGDVDCCTSYLYVFDDPLLCRCGNKFSKIGWCDVIPANQTLWTNCSRADAALHNTCCLLFNASGSPCQ